MDNDASNFFVAITATLSTGAFRVINISTNPLVALTVRTSSASVFVGYRPRGEIRQEERDNYTDRSLSGTHSGKAIVSATFETATIAGEADVTSAVSRIGNTVTVTGSGSGSMEWHHNGAEGSMVGIAGGGVVFVLRVERPVTYAITSTVRDNTSWQFIQAAFQVQSGSSIIYRNSSLLGTTGEPSGILQPGSHRFTATAGPWVPRENQLIEASFEFSVTFVPTDGGSFGDAATLLAPGSGGDGRGVVER